VLKAVGYVESQWQMVTGEVEFDGLDPAFGTMALRGKNLSRGAALLGVEEDSLKSVRQINIRAAAAVLREKADAAQDRPQEPRRVGPGDRRALGHRAQVGGRDQLHPSERLQR
jgi:hypothetical protein